MQASLSVSKGVFVYKNGAKAAPKRGRQKKKQMQYEMMSDSLWYVTYKTLWRTIDTKIKHLNDEMFSNVLSNLVKYVKDSYKAPVTEIPSAALLKGINMPDHAEHFRSLTMKLKAEVTPHVVRLNSEDCQSLKYLVETMMAGLISSNLEDDGLLDEEDSGDDTPRRVKKSQCSFAHLQSWYEGLYHYPPALNGTPLKKQKTKDNRKPIVVIVSDFEAFSESVLQDFILIASSYINILPFVLIFGVATSVTVLHKSLPYHVSSKVNIEVFNSPPSTACLNSVVENVLFSSECPFHLGGKVFNLFTDIFLFYDLSVSGFIKNFKYAMLEHFSYGNAMALCRKDDLKKVLWEFDHDDLENVRHLMSFRKFVENEPPEIRIKLLTDDEYFRTALYKEVKKIKQYLSTFHLFLKCLHILVEDLPKTPLGKQLRELYSVAVSSDISESPEYKECFQLLGFQSKDELSSKISRIVSLLKSNSTLGFDEFITDQLKSFLQQLNDLHCDNNMNTEDSASNTEDDMDEIVDRIKLKMKLMEISKRRKPMNKYEKIRSSILKFMSEIFCIYLPEPKSHYFHEIFFFNDIGIQNHIIGSHRAAIHTALNDPHFYLQCSCCSIAEDSVIRRTMPDISIAYKLHLECGKMINLYDWLQAFLSVIDPQTAEDEEEDDSGRVIVPEMQARFTQAVAELEYLGFIKSSRRKADHVARLTWGG